MSVIEDGDMITLDVAQRLLHVDVAAEVLEKRKQQKALTQNVFTRGYVSLYTGHVQQAHLGADFDFLKGASGSEVTRDSH